MKRHIIKAHPTQWLKAADQLEEKCKAFSCHLTRGASCPFYQNGGREPTMAAVRTPPARTQSTTRHEIQKGGRRHEEPCASKQTAPTYASQQETEAGDLVQLLAKLVLQHEDSLNVHCQDTAFTLYLCQHPPTGILAQLFKISQKWHQEREKLQTQAHRLLRVVILGLLIQEMGQQLSLLNSKAEAKKDAVKKDILTEAGQLTFEKWDRTQQQLVPDADRPPLGVDEVSVQNPSTSSTQHASSKKSRRKMPKQPSWSKSAYAISSHPPRTPSVKLQDNAVWRLMGGQLRGPTLQRKGLAQALQKQLYTNQQPKAGPLQMQLLQIALSNEGNTCYINATLLALLWQVMMCGKEASIPATWRRTLSQERLNPLTIIRFQLMGWQRLHAQHDVAKFA